MNLYIDTACCIGSIQNNSFKKTWNNDHFMRRRRFFSNVKLLFSRYWLAYRYSYVSKNKLFIFILLLLSSSNKSFLTMPKFRISCALEPLKTHSPLEINSVSNTLGVFFHTQFMGSSELKRSTEWEPQRITEKEEKYPAFPLLLGVGWCPENVSNAQYFSYKYY